MTATNFFTGGMLSTNISVLATLLKEDIGLTSGQFGVIFAMSGIVTGLLGAFPGILIDKIGPKRGMILGYFLTWTPMVLFPLIQTPGRSFWPSFSRPSAARSTCRRPRPSSRRSKSPTSARSWASTSGKLHRRLHHPDLFPPPHPRDGRSWRNVIWLFTGITLMFGLFAIFTISRLDIGHADVSSPPAALTRASRCPPSADAACGRCRALCRYHGHQRGGEQLAAHPHGRARLRHRDGRHHRLLSDGGRPGNGAAGAPLFRKAAAQHPDNPHCRPCGAGHCHDHPVVADAFPHQGRRPLRGIAFNFLSLHAQRDIISSAPEHVSGKYVSTINACANCAA